MTAENQGPDASQGDDPFAYLYRQEGGSEGEATAQQPGVPRRSYNQVRAVGERQYGGQQQPGTQQTAAFPQQAPGQGSPSAHYAAPETMPGGRAATRRQSAGGGHGGGGGGNRNGLLIGAVAVVAAVVIGIGTAMFFNEDSGSTAGPQAGSTPSADTGGGQQGKGKKNGQGKNTPVDLPERDAATLRLGGSAHVDKAVPGAQSKGGTYVTGMNATGSSVTWAVDVPEGGKYTVFTRYTVPGEDATGTLTVNGDPHDRPLNMKNFARAKKGDWEKGWTNTYAWINLKKGENRISVSCGSGDKCHFALDRMWLKAGWVKD